MNLYEKRLSRIRTAMHGLGLRTLILTPGSAMLYATGFSEPAHERLLAVVIPDDRPWLFVAPALYAEQIRANPAEVSDIRLWGDGVDWATLLDEISKELQLELGIVGLDDDMPARFALRIAELMPITLIKLAGPVFDQLRATKDTLEVASMQAAADATDALIPVAYEACKAGASELDVAMAIDRARSRAGAEASFTSIVGAGPNGASPHHHTGKTELREGDVVILDFGAKIDGYCGDITRTVAIKTASSEARDIYGIVYRAHQAALQAVEPGITAHRVDAAARKVIEEAGYAEFFIHRTGHGIGLDEHEAPNIVAGNHTVLQPGHCFSIEPGIYLPGKFGVRLENIVMVAEDGFPRVLNEPIAPEIPIVGN